MRIVVAIFGLLGAVGLCAGRTITVDDDGPADFATIQAGIDDANDGDTVLIADGTYTGDGNRDIDFLGKGITVKSVNGPESCVIDCNGSEADPHRGFYFHNGEGPESVLSGITITHGYAIKGGGINCVDSGPTIIECGILNNSAIYGGGLHVRDSVPQIAECAIVGNSADAGGGIFYFYSLASFGGAKFLANCIVAGNSALEGGGTWIYAAPNRPLVFENCTFVRNSAELGGGLVCYAGSIDVQNCILWGDMASTGKEVLIPGTSMPPYASVWFFYSDLEGGHSGVHSWGAPYWFKEGMMNADPCFVDSGFWDPNGTLDDANDDFWVNGDYHLKSQAGRWDASSESWIVDNVTSPCIDAGDPMSSLGFEPFPNGGIVNMGAYGGTSEASKSWFGGPVCQVIVAGDVNGDCIVDFRDFQIMALHWMEDR